MVKKQRMQVISWALILGMTASSVLTPLQVKASGLEEPTVSMVESESEQGSEEEKETMSEMLSEVQTENEEEPLTNEGEESEISSETETEETEIETDETEEESESEEEKAATRAGGELQGIYAEYYLMNGTEFGALKSKTIDFDINYGNMDDRLLTQTGKDDHAGVKWSGKLTVPEDGKYTFYGYADNGIRMWITIDGVETQLFNFWDAGKWDILQTSNEIELEAGTYYDYRVDYFEAVGGSHVSLSWSNDKNIGTKKVIPGSAFYLPDTYNNVYVSEIDTSDAVLEDSDNFDGKLTVRGLGFTTDTEFEVIKSSGAAVEGVTVTRTGTGTDTEVELEVSRLGTGTYKIQATEDGITVPSKGMFVVRPVGESGAIREEHPQQLWKRAGYVNLNGQWDFAFDPYGNGETEGWYKEDYPLLQQINVPFSWETTLSGVADENYQGEAWYKKTVLIDESWKDKKVFLMFGAVDWKCKLWVNDVEVENGEHIGGYSAFEVDITDYITVGGTNTFALWVEDRGSYGDDSYPALIGKQGRNAPCGYTRTSGIWQTVGMEAREETFLGHARAATDVDASTVTYEVDITAAADKELTVEYEFTGMIYDIETDQDYTNGSVIPRASQTVSVQAGENTVTLDPIAVSDAKLWNYNSPNLYYGTITLKDGNTVLDTVETYFGMRKVEQKYFDESLGVKYFYVNDEPVYMSGLLDQGYWEGGVYTAPSEDALKYDVIQMKLAGFNMLRKHLKVEDPLQYYWCDKVGMFLWQDMPHATNMVPNKEGDVALGRTYYEEGLEDMMKRNYNHPSVVAVMLFNETWGLGSAYADGGAKRNVKAADGKSTKEWIEYLYDHTKEINPNLLVEDMSACNRDHVQPTDMNTYHMYPGDYAGTLGDVEYNVNGAKVGSSTNFAFGEVQDGDVFMNSEYGGVAAYAGDFDVSYCFKYMTDIQRRYEKQSGFVYTEPYDVEYERNGIMTYDRQMKVFGYDEVAYGGDMGINDLTQEIYVGIVDDPIRYVKPGQKMNTKAMAIGWTNDLPETVTMKWRFDGTDIYGNSISTGASGTKTLAMSPYRRSDFTILYTAPKKACVGTLTVWLEDAEGNKLAKNFTNVVVSDETSKNEAYVQTNEDQSVTMKAKVTDERMDKVEAGAAKEYSYTLPEGFDVTALRGMRILAEVSSYKKQLGTDKFHSSYASAWAQTAEGRERASDVTIKVNGVEIDTVYLPDDPRDIRGTLTLNKLDAPSNQKTSAGDFGYLVNLNITDDQLAAIAATIGADNKITVSYGNTSGNQNGLRIYSSTYGRYAVNPTVILNPVDQVENGEIATEKKVATDSNNYSVEAVLEAGEGYVVRASDNGGYLVQVSGDGTTVEVLNAKTGDRLGVAAVSGKTLVKTTLFDDQIRVYLNNDPEAVVNVYDKSGFTGGVTLKAGVEDAVVAPESYTAEESTVQEPGTVEKEIDFSDSNLDTQFDKMGNDLSATVSNGALNISGRSGDKLIVKDINMADGVYEADVKVNSLYDGGGNTGFAFRSSNYHIGSDGLDGYYVGIGNGYIQVGRMSNNWKELAKVSVPKLTLGSTHRLKVAVYGSRIQVYLDDDTEPYVDITDSTYLEGGAAIRTFQAASTIDNIKIASEVNYRSDFTHGVGEWITSGKWTNKSGAYQASGAEALAYIDGIDKQDISVTADLKAVEEDGKPSLLIRGKEGTGMPEGYRIVLNAEENKIQFVKMKEQTETILKERLWKFDAGKSYKVTVEAKGDQFKVYVDSASSAAMEISDSDFAKGIVGLYNDGSAVEFDNLVINHQYADGAVSADKVQETIDIINEIGTVQLDDSTKAKIEEARKAYDKLSADEKTLISNYQVLETAESVYKALADGKQKEADQIAASAVEKMIDEIGTVDYSNASRDKIKAAEDAYNKLTEAQKKLVKNYSKITQAQTEYKRLEEAAKQQGKNAIKEGSTYSVGNYKYKVTSLKNKTVKVTGVTKKTLKSISVKATVKIKGQKFTVTEIGKSAFKNCKKATKVTIGKNVKTIGTKAFYGCKKVKTVIIKGTKLKKVGSKAFKGIKKTATIKVPKKKLKAYQKMLRGKGQSKSVKIKKK